MYSIELNRFTNPSAELEGCCLIDHAWTKTPTTSSSSLHLPHPTFSHKLPPKLLSANAALSKVIYPHVDPICETLTCQHLIQPYKTEPPSSKLELTFWSSSSFNVATIQDYNQQYASGIHPSTTKCYCSVCELHLSQRKRCSQGERPKVSLPISNHSLDDSCHMV